MDIELKDMSTVYKAIGTEKSPQFKWHFFVCALLFSPAFSALCGGNLTTLEGTIYSPGHPDDYPNLKDCAWTIRVPPGNGIYINFTVLNTEPIYDYITVW